MQRDPGLHYQLSIHGMVLRFFIHCTLSTDLLSDIDIDCWEMFDLLVTFHAIATLVELKTTLLDRRMHLPWDLCIALIESIAELAHSSVFLSRLHSMNHALEMITQRLKEAIQSAEMIETQVLDRLVNSLIKLCHVVVLVDCPYNEQLAISNDSLAWKLYLDLPQSLQNDSYLERIFLLLGMRNQTLIKFELAGRCLQPFRLALEMCLPVKSKEHAA